MTTPTIHDFRADVAPGYRHLYDAIADDHPDVRARLNIERTHGNDDPAYLARVAHTVRYALALAQGREDGTWQREYEAGLIRWNVCPACDGPATGRTRWDARCADCQDAALAARIAAAAAQVLPDGRTRAQAVADYDAARAERASA